MFVEGAIVITKTVRLQSLSVYHLYCKYTPDTTYI